jgi:hypothetical protein
MTRWDTLVNISVQLKVSVTYTDSTFFVGVFNTSTIVELTNVIDCTYRTEDICAYTIVLRNAASVASICTSDTSHAVVIIVIA